MKFGEQSNVVVKATLVMSGEIKIADSLPVSVFPIELRKNKFSSN